MKYDLKKSGYGWRGFLAPHFISRHNTHQFINNKDIFERGAVYQFGVWNGFSLQVLSSLFKLLKQNGTSIDPKYFAFDVFTGMPVEEEEPQNQVDDPGWYNLLEHFGVDNMEEALELLEDDIRYNMGRWSELTFVPGLVQDTLTDELAKTLLPATYVDMDMDIYSPTRVALDFLFKHNLIVEGTIIGYDDWVQVETLETYEGGEARAHKEIMEKYNVTTIQLIEHANRGQAAFLVVNIGGVNE